MSEETGRLNKILILHCPENGKLEFKYIKEGLQSFYDLLNCETIDIKMLDEDGLSVVSDGEERFNEEKHTNPNFHPVMQNYFGYGIVGDYMFIKVDFETGEIVSLEEEHIAELMKLIDIEKKPEVIEGIKNQIMMEKLYLEYQLEEPVPQAMTDDELNEFFDKWSKSET